MKKIATFSPNVAMPEKINAETLMKSGQIWSAGMIEMSLSMTDTLRAHFDNSMVTWEAFKQVKSLKELLELQATHMKASMDTTMSESTKLGEATMKLVGKTIEPFAAQPVPGSLS